MATDGNRSAPATGGTAVLVRDPARPHGWTLLVHGVAQSYVDLGDPGHLAYEYVRRIATVLRVCAAASVPLTVLHLGGGALTLARWVATTRPGSAQTVVDRDGALLDLVTAQLPPPAATTLVVADARDFVEARTETRTGLRYDVIVADVFNGAAMPVSVATTGFAAAAARLLRPGGVLVMNVADIPPLAYSRIQIATLRAVFGDVALIAAVSMMRGRRAGNVVLAAASTPGDLPVARIAAAVARDIEPGRVLHGPDLDIFVSGARARLDAPN